ncbi:uncharacterized protein B0T23DRAFT_158271 [Neurospora hispaniola]|uniref:Uncharacterized protein n=1 Tax=Neurospora hispaniola TaxID=588809 RepID=A0AAJ0I552_9PEZI|nr:hypothetical protein B0T23DRAFT_158271 [Neurospora hispaniola]
MMGDRHYSILVFLFSFVLGWIGKKTWVAGKNCFSLHLDFLYFLVFSHLVLGCTTTSGWISSRRQPSSPAQRIMAPISFSCHITTVHHLALFWRIHILGHQFPLVSPAMKRAVSVRLAGSRLYKIPPLVFCLVNPLPAPLISELTHV